MAKKVANGMNKRQPRKRSRPAQSLGVDFSSTESNFKTGSKRSMGSGRENYSQLIREILSNPAVKYVAGGIAASILSRLAINMSEKYPELSKFMRENLDNFEGKLGQYRTGMSGERESRA